MSEHDPIVSSPVAARPDVLLLGFGATALSALRSLIASCNVLGVLTTEDRVRTYAAEHGITSWALENPSDLSAIIVRLRPQAVVISSFNRILSPDVLALSRFVNVHYSPLPKYRGRANVNWAIINGEPATAISIHLVAPGLDDGNLLYQEQVVIEATDTAQSIYEGLNAIQERELGSAVIRAVAGDPGSPQDHRCATYGCARVPDDGEIDWSRSSLVIDRLIRALVPPFPGAFTYLEGRRLVIARAGRTENSPRYEGSVPGRVVGRSGSEGWVDVLTGDGVLRLFEVIHDSAAITPAASVIRSTRTTLGLSTSDLLRRIDALERRLMALEAANSHSPVQK